MAKTRRPTRFNAVREAERLYFSLIRKGETTAAASILGRLLAGTEHSVPEEDNTWIDWATTEELAAIDRMVAEGASIKAACITRQRAGDERPVIERPDASPYVPPTAASDAPSALPAAADDLEPGEYVDADGVHWWRDPNGDPNAEPLPYCDPEDDPGPLEPEA